MKIAPNNGADENAGFFLSVTWGHVHHVRLHHHRPSAVGRRVEGGDGAVVGQAVVSADDPEADDVALVVKYLEALGAAHGWHAGDDSDLPQRADVAVSQDDVAALDEVLVGLRVVEAADDWPDGGDGGRDELRGGGAGLVWADGVGVVAGHVVGDLCRRRLAVRLFVGGGGGGCFADSLKYEGGFL